MGTVRPWRCGVESSLAQMESSASAVVERLRSFRLEGSTTSRRLSAGPKYLTSKQFPRSVAGSATRELIDVLICTPFLLDGVLQTLAGQARVLEQSQERYGAGIAGLRVAPGFRPPNLRMVILKQSICCGLQHGDIRLFQIEAVAKGVHLRRSNLRPQAYAQSQKQCPNCIHERMSPCLPMDGNTIPNAAI
jgi:hypothetical protein